jgi:ADP-L-glycero-D-manno-heptose 6-epimerase
MGARAQIFRYFNVYGPEGEEHKGSQASPYAQFKRQAETIGKIQVFEGSDRFLRDFVPVSRIVETHLKFLNVKESGVWNVGTGTPRSFMSVAKEFGVPIETVPMPDILKDSYQKYTCADMTRYNTTVNKL